MALIKQFEQARSVPAGYRTEVDCGWRVADSDGRRLLHLETYGSRRDRARGKRAKPSISMKLAPQS
jgi:hypothetical protein